MLFFVIRQETPVADFCSVFFALVARSKFCPIWKHEAAREEVASRTRPANRIRECAEWRQWRLSLGHRVEIEKISQHVVVRLPSFIEQRSERLKYI